MRKRLVILVACLAACFGTALVAVPLSQASARPSAFSYRVLDMCSADLDGKECVMSASRNDVPITSDCPTSVGTHECFYVDNGWRDGIWSFNLNTVTVPPSGPTTSSKFVDVTGNWMIQVNTGSDYPREYDGKTQNTVFTRGGNATDGYWFRLEFNPVPIAWRFFDNTFTCDMTSCGDNSTVADFASGDGQGDSDGYVTDLADSGLGARYVYARTGFFLASNAQFQQEPYYDAETNSIVVNMANPHLRSAAPDVPATGFFETFLPNSYLITQLAVPDPSTLKTGSFVITKTVGGVTSTALYNAVADSEGVHIKINTVSFSRPTYKIHPKPHVPGKPRMSRVIKITGGAKSYFLRPLANGGKPIDKYQAACRRAGSTWHFKTGTRSPITMTSLPSGTVYCQVRAHNVVGWGPWGKAAASHT